MQIRLFIFVSEKEGIPHNHYNYLLKATKSRKGDWNSKHLARKKTLLHENVYPDSTPAEMFSAMPFSSECEKYTSSVNVPTQVHLPLPFTCEICQKGYATKAGLALHTQTHQGKSYMCPVCDAKFTQRGTMKRHLKSIHLCLQCPTCEGVFQCGPSFQKHVLECH